MIQMFEVFDATDAATAVAVAAADDHVMSSANSGINKKNEQDT